MTFKVEPMTLADTDAVSTQKNIDGIKNIAKIHRDQFGQHWVVDRERNVYFFLLWPNDPRDSKFIYLLSFEDDPIVIEVKGYNSVIFLRLPDFLMPRTQEIKMLIREAFKVGGRWCNGETEDIMSFEPQFKNCE